MTKRMAVLRALGRLAVRPLSGTASSQIGVLHVYRLERAERPAGTPLRLYLPTAGDDGDAAAQLEAAAASGEPLLVPESALAGLVGGDDGVTPARIEAGDGQTGAPSGSLARVPDGSDALAELSAHAQPLVDTLGTAREVARPDWKSMAAHTHSHGAAADQQHHDHDDHPQPHQQPTSAQQAVLAAAATGDVAALADAMASCPVDEVRSAVQAPAGASALHLAAVSGSLAAVRALLDSPAAAALVQSQASNGSTALHWASGGGELEIVRALLAAGADTRLRSSTWGSTVRGNDSGQTAAHWAASSGQTETLRALLAHDPHAIVMEDERQMAPSAIAARDGHPWLETALSSLERERVVCVRVRREATMQRPLAAVRAEAADGGGAPFRRESTALLEPNSTRTTPARERA